MTSETPGRSGGLAGDLRRIVDEALELVRIRVALLGVELQEEKIHLAGSLMLALVAAFWGLLGLLMLSLAVILLVPDLWRPAGAALLAMMDLLGAWLVWRRVERRLRDRRPFAATQAQLERDRECLAWMK